MIAMVAEGCAGVSRVGERRGGREGGNWRGVEGAAARVGDWSARSSDALIWSRWNC